MRTAKADPAPAAELVAEGAQAVEQMESGVAGPLGVVLVGKRRAEQRHDAVAGVLVDRPLEAMHALVQEVEESVQHPVPFLGAHALGQLHRVLDVGEQHRDLLALAFERRRGR